MTRVHEWRERDEQEHHLDVFKELVPGGIEMEEKYNHLIERWCRIRGLGDFHGEKLFKQCESARDPRSGILILQSLEKVSSNFLCLILLLKGLRRMEINGTNNSIIHLGSSDIKVPFILRG